MGGQPLFILDEDAQRTHGKDAQSSNIAAGKAVSESVRTTLGPRGMDKMLVSDDGDVVITNDGATILSEMDIEHPAAQMIVEVAQTQEDEVGDGTTTASVLAGELLAKAEDLLDDDVHPTTIVEGYHRAAELAQEAIAAENLDADLDDETLIEVAESSMTGKGTGDVDANRLAEVIVEAVTHVQTDDGIIRDNIRVHTQTGAATSATELVEGVIIDDTPVHDNMPTSVEDASIAVVDAELDVKDSNVGAEYNVSSVDQLNAALDAEEDELQGYAEDIVESGADVVFVTDDIADRVASQLAKAGVLAVESVSSSTAKDIVETTGAKRLGSVDALDADALGSAEEITVQKHGDDEVTFITGGAAAEAVTVFARGSTDHVVDEIERALNDALDVVVAALDAGGVVPGAGATEIAIADHIRSEAASIEGRKQLAVEAFADAVDVLPRTLAENTGLDAIDALVDLRSEHDSEGIAGVISEGQTGIIGDPVDYGILDPAAVKREAVESATEASTMIVRIDDVISSS